MTLIEVLIGLGIMAILSAVLIPQIVQRQRSGRAAAIASNITAIRTAALEFRKAVGRYPSQVAHLSTLPAVGSTDLCGRVVPFDFGPVWQGPYIQQTVTASGIRVGDATIQNAIGRNPATLAGGVLANLLINVSDVDLQVAMVIENAMDSAVDLAAGTIRWANVADDRGTLTMVVPVRGC